MTTEQMTGNPASEWSMSDEREFMENLLNQRFNFFMLVFAIVIGSAVQVKEQLHLQLLLSVGAILLMMFLPTLYRAQVKLDKIIWILKKRSKESGKLHPVTEVDKELIEDGHCNWSVRRYIGFYIPTVCTLMMLAGMGTAWLGILQISSSPQ
ncbi:hypothetical protein [Dongia sp.]|uniref:hypothetical protein n=1 Tax=Dongia sp. TaxID=1977262 RepID=UPI0035B385F2